MKIPFYKFHGAGNDFILIDNRENIFPVDPVRIEAICHRRFGMGADGLILLEKAEGYDFRMRYFNSDGRESTMCGNGGRCITAFADFLSLVGKECLFITSDGIHKGNIISRQNNAWQVRISMANVTEVRTLGPDFIINTGSPHFVRFVRAVGSVDVVSQGRKIRYSDAFSREGINVDFAEVRDNELLVRTYERGVEDETLSCGTGVTATSLAYAASAGLESGPVNIITKGGSLVVDFEKDDKGFSSIYLEGPAMLVFSGEMETGSDFIFGHEHTKRY